MSVAGSVAGSVSGQFRAIDVPVKKRGRPGTSRAGRAFNSVMLTTLDARILEGVATGMTTAQLATMLHLSRQGIAYHIGAMMHRFRARNRTALVSRAFSAGIFQVGCWPPEVLPDYIAP